MAGKKGRSGRRPMLEELKKHALVKTSYEITQAYLDHKKEPLKEKVHIAVGIVKTDMSKPVNAYVINNNENTVVEHKTVIEFKDKNDTDLIDFLTGRNSGIVTGKSDRKS